MQKEDMNPELVAVETLLKSLSPADVQMNRDHLIYAAGSRAANRRAQRTQRMWQASTAAVVLLSIGLIGMSFFRRHRRSHLLVVERHPPHIVGGDACEDRPNHSAPRQVAELRQYMADRYRLGGTADVECMASAWHHRRHLGFGSGCLHADHWTTVQPGYDPATVQGAATSS